MEITLSETERQLLVELLKAELDQAPAEIHHTQTIAVREMLKDREAVVQALLQRLKGE